jgi:hypothetical protein
MKTQVTGFVELEILYRTVKERMVWLVRKHLKKTQTFSLVYYGTPVSSKQSTVQNNHVFEFTKTRSLKHFSVLDHICHPKNSLGNKFSRTGQLSNGLPPGYANAIYDVVDAPEPPVPPASTDAA